MRHLLIGAAALALAATGASADPGGKGQGNGGGNSGAAMKADKGPSMKADRGPAMKADRGPSMNAGSAKESEGPSMKADRGPAAKAERGPAMKAERGPAMKQAKSDSGPPAKAMRQEQAGSRIDERRGQQGPGVRKDRGAERTFTAGPNFRTDGRGDARYGGTVQRVSFGSDQRGLVPGCPPGLAKKNNGCTPPGLARQREDYRSGYYNPQYFGYRSLGDGRYYVDDGYLYRTSNSGSILGFLPLLGGALAPGNTWPSYYQSVDVPDYYVDYYNLGPQDTYRYADNVFYRVNPQNSTISSIAALLTGNQFAVGQPMPAGYDIYNVPSAYQDRYYDTPDSMYRYSDGYIYQADPTTQLVQAIIELVA